MSTSRTLTMSVQAQNQVQVTFDGTPTVSAAATNPAEAAVELQQLSAVIKGWKELHGETSSIKEQLREKTKRLKAMEEMILRIMKKNNIGALDLASTGGRLLYRKTNSKASLAPKTLQLLLTEHLKSDAKAAEAMKYITEHRETKARESLLYEKEVE